MRRLGPSSEAIPSVLSTPAVASDRHSPRRRRFPERDSASEIRLQGAKSAGVPVIPTPERQRKRLFQKGSSALHHSFTRYPEDARKSAVYRADQGKRQPAGTSGLFSRGSNDLHSEE